MLGNIISDIHLNELNETEISSIKTEVTKHGVICIKDQKLSVPEMVSVTKQFGQPVLLPEGLRFNNTQDEFPELARVSNILPNGEVIKNHTAAEYWHVDGDFWSNGKNYIFNFLHAVIVPETGGETGFVDSRAVYQALSDEMKERIQDLQFLSSCADIPDFKHAKKEELLPDAYHNLTYRHPETNLLSLYVNYFGTRIPALPSDESQELLKQLEAVVERSEFQYIHRWSPGDILIWDNTSVMHRSMGGYQEHKRLLYRTQAFMA